MLPPISDPETKYVITARDVMPSSMTYTLLWRAIGKGSKPLPRIGQQLTMPDGHAVIVERIDPPGTPIAQRGDRVLYINARKPAP